MPNPIIIIKISIGMKMKFSFLLFFACCLWLSASAQVQSYPAEAGQAQFLGTSRPLSVLAGEHAFTRTSKAKLRQVVPKTIPNFTQRQRVPRHAEASARPFGPDPLAVEAGQRSQNLLVEPRIVAEGVDRDLVGGVSPPDPCGDHNGEHYIQMANASGGAILTIYDNEGNLTFTLPSLNMLWSQFGASGLGDPIVLWDQAAGRWLISEFQDFGGNSLLVAISQTADPTGSWYAYRFQTPSFPDYPKYSIWHNAYLVTTNEGGDNIPIYALERAAMLEGEEAGVQRLGIPKFSGGGFQVATPVDWDGNTPPPPGSPGHVVRMYDDAWEGGQDKVEIWDIVLDWNNPDNSFASGPTDLIGGAFDSNICPNGAFFDCIEQPNGQRVDGLQEIILHRVPYLNFGSYESIVLHFAVDVDGADRAGLRWMELRRDSPEAPWSLYQEGTFSKDDGLSRFAGGIAMDFNGNIFMAYSVGGPGRDLSLRYTGRLANDPLGQMTIEEFEFAEGLSSQQGARWGDYASMSVDPLTGNSFWFTGEYMRANGDWGTKIMSATIRRDSNDVGVAALAAPRNSGYLTATEEVQVVVRNYGYKPMSDIQVFYQFEDGPLVEELITDTIPADSTYLHTFAPTVDLSALGNYEFTLITAHPLDTALFNDTLRTVVTQLPRNDVGIVNIQGLGSVVCDSSVLTTLSIINEGVDTLTSAFISYGLNGEVQPDINWSGSLAPGQTADIVVEVGPLLDGPNELAFSVGFPNGVVDENPANDSRELTFEAALSGQGVSFLLNTDVYPEETTWALVDENGQEVATGGPYFTDLVLETADFCLRDGCYTLRLFDSFGDGLIGPPPGNAQIVDEEGNVLALLGEINFGASTTLPFCLPFECTLALEASAENESEPGAEDGRIILSADNGIGDFEYSIDGGASFQSSPVFNNLAGGTYTCLVQDLNGCTAEAEILVPTCAIQLTAEVTPDTDEDESPTGSILVSVSGAQGAISYQLDNGPVQESNLFEGLAPGSYVITVRDDLGCERELLVEVDFVSDARSVFYGTSVKIAPNPTEGFVEVSIKGLKGVSFLPYRIVTAQGQVARHGQLVTYGETTRGPVSFFNLPAGTYYLWFDGLQTLYPVVKK